MELVVVGAAGRTGRLIVERALDAKHTVTAVVRDPARLRIARDKLTVATADVMDPESLAAPLVGKDAVAVVLGVPDRSTTTVFSDGVRNILLAAAAGGVRRVVVMSSAGLETKHLPVLQRAVAEFVVDRVFRNIHLDLHRMEDVIEASDTDWTIVRAPMLTDGPATPGYQVVVGGHLPRARRVARANVADCIVSHLEDPTTYQQRIEVSD
ncbi:NAD(P)-binding oxidoreductase [Streptomyces sp. NPDC049954]|uniref:NAD(P)-dependent oxidoreductase n=1 Tax=Streptomyces sp. NPDC049954 TaxID=3155779 RepID=UPI00342CA591